MIILFSSLFKFIYYKLNGMNDMGKDKIRYDMLCYNKLNEL